MTRDDESIVAFVSLEPDASLAALIAGFKETVRSTVGEQLYLSDPPHLTVYLAAFPSAAVLVDTWPKLSALFADMTVDLVGWHVFHADALTGSHTLVCGLAEHDKDRLRSLQREVISVLAPLRDAAISRARYEPRLASLTAVQQKCVAELGFPYCGQDWQPHFTIASIQPDAWPAAWSVLASHAPRGVFRCSNLRLYHLIEGQPWQTLA